MGLGSLSSSADDLLMPSCTPPAAARLIGMWKAFAELKELGLISEDTKLPKMVAVQATGCAPMVNAFEAGEEFATRVDDAYTRSAMGIRVPAAVGDFLILRAVRESGGWAVAVDDDAIDEGVAEFAKDEGFLLCPEGARRTRRSRRDSPRGKSQRQIRCSSSTAPRGSSTPCPRRTTTSTGTSPSITTKSPRGSDEAF